MTLDELHALAVRIKEHNVQLQIQSMGRPWTLSETTLGFASDVGDLARLIMQVELLRPQPEDLHERLRHELADCLWSVLTIANELNIDLTQALMDLQVTVESREI